MNNTLGKIHKKIGEEKKTEKNSIALTPTYVQGLFLFFYRSSWA